MNYPRIKYSDDEKIIFNTPSRSNPEEIHMVTWDFDDGWLCDCKGCLKGGYLCKHILDCVAYMKFLNMALLDDPYTVFGTKIEANGLRAKGV